MESIKKFVIKDKHGNVKEQNGFSVLGGVHVEADGGVGEPYATHEYVDGELYISLHNFKGEGISSIAWEASPDDAGNNYLVITTDGDDTGGANVHRFAVKNGSRGNGITSIVSDEQTGDGAVNDVTIYTDDAPEGTTFHVRNGSRGNGIDHVTEELETDDGATNTYTIVDTDGDEHVFHVKNGRQGLPGESANAGAGDLVLSDNLGNSRTVAFSQKGVTDIVVNNFVSGWTQVATQSDTSGITNTQSMYMKYPNNVFTSGGTSNHVYSIAVNQGDIIRVRVTNGAYGDNYKGSVGFSASLPAANGSYSELYRASGNDFDTVVVAPGAGYIHAFFYTGSSAKFWYYKPKSIAEKINEDSASTAAAIAALEETVDDAMDGLDEIITTVIEDLTPGTPPSTYNAAASQGGTYRMVINESDHSQDRWETGNSDNRFGYQRDIQAYVGSKIRVTPGSTRTAIGFLTVPYSSTQKGQLVQYCTGGELQFVSSATVITIPEGAKYLWVPWKETNTSGQAKPNKLEIVGSIADKVKDLKSSVVTYHVDEVNGSDDNDGLTESTALATVAMAVAKSGTDVSMVLHGTFRTPISIIGKNAVKISGDNAKIHYGTIIDTAELASGYDNVYVKEITLPSGYTKNNVNYGLWLWQSGVADTSTAITQAEKHPCQRNKTVRMASSKIQIASSVSAVASASDLRYYYDSTNHLLYFKIAGGTTLASNPVVVRKASNDYAIRIECNELLMSAVSAFYAAVMLKCTKAELFGCRCLYGANGFRSTETDNSEDYENVVYNRCEAAGCFAESGNGDGFGSQTGHSTLIDCWAHDNFDDGYSEHAGSESMIIGGLFEYCGKGGIVPSSTTTTIIGATCRHNGGKPATSNTAGIMCVKSGETPIVVNAKNCVSYDNVYNYYAEGNGCTVVLEGCQSLNGTTAGYRKEDSVVMILRNCTDSGSTNAKSGSMTIQNGTTV